MKNAVFTGVLALFTITLSAQFTGQIPTNMSAGGSSDQGALSGAISSLLGPIAEADSKRSSDYEEFKGSPYISNDFSGTTLYFKEERIGDIYYRYNALNQEIEIKQDNSPTEGIRALGRSKDIAILVKGKPMSFKTFIDKNDHTMNGYLIALESSGDYTLYKRHHVQFQEGQKAQNSFVKAIPARFTQFVEYYVEIAGKNRIDEIKLKKSSLLNHVSGDKKDALKAYLKQEGLNCKKEMDLVKAVNFLNS